MTVHLSGPTATQLHQRTLAHEWNETLREGLANVVGEDRVEEALAAGRLLADQLIEPCPDCGGRGYLIDYMRVGPDGDEQRVDTPCEACNGTGTR